MLIKIKKSTGSLVKTLWVRRRSRNERELTFLLSITRNIVFPVRRDNLFLLALRIGCVILLWHSLGLTYKFFTQYFLLSPTETRDIIK